ncbi:MAG: hypothetical protein ACYTGQ_11110, partial [Planctomycetota bacterium]
MMIRRSGFVLRRLGVLGVALWCGLVAWAQPGSTGTEKKSGAPWGRLAVSRHVLQAPPGNLEREAKPDVGNPWRFGMSTRQGVQGLLLRAGLPPREVAVLMMLAQDDPKIAGVIVHPTPSQVAGLSPESRAVIYLELARHPLNEDQDRALCFAGESVEQWLAGGSLREATIALVKRYAYRNGPFWKVADLRPIRRELADEAEYARLLSCLYREHSWRMALKVREGADVSGLVGYWGRGGRERKVERVLKRVAARPGGGRVKLSRLLPPFPGRVLNTYTVGEYRFNRNCHWFALNFFNETPEGRFEEVGLVKREIDEQYEFIEMSDLRFGDLLCYSNQLYGVIHTAVYIADGKVMTKNGPSLVRPFMLMALETMKSYYPSPGPVE